MELNRGQLGSFRSRLSAGVPLPKKSSGSNSGWIAAVLDSVALFYLVEKSLAFLVNRGRAFAIDFVQNDKVLQKAVLDHLYPARVHLCALPPEVNCQSTHFPDIVEYLLNVRGVDHQRIVCVLFGTLLGLVFFNRIVVDLQVSF